MPAGRMPNQVSRWLCVRRLLSALSGSPGGFATNTLAGRKQGVRLVPTWTALQHRGSGAAVDADTLAIRNEAVASGVSPGAAAARPKGPRVAPARSRFQYTRKRQYGRSRRVPLRAMRPKAALRDAVRCRMVFASSQPVAPSITRCGRKPPCVMQYDAAWCLHHPSLLRRAAGTSGRDRPGGRVMRMLLSLRGRVQVSSCTAFIATAAITLSGAIGTGVAQAAEPLAWSASTAIDSQATGEVAAQAKQDTVRLADLIRESARRTHGHAPGSVVHKTGVLNVAFGAAPGPVSRYGVYTFALEEWEGQLGVNVAINKLTKPWRSWYDPPIPPESATYMFELSPSETIGTTLFNAAMAIQYGRAPMRSYEAAAAHTLENGSVILELTDARLEAAYHQALEVIHRAERHAPLPHLHEVY